MRKLCKDITGATSIEYAVIASVISVAAIGAFLGLGERSNEQLGTVHTAYEEANARGE